MRADVAIITTRIDEFESVLKRFSPNKPLKGSSGRTYGICQVKTRSEKICTVALVRCSEMGNDTSQQVANDIIRDLKPNILLVVGIAAGVPDDELTLGDVIISSRIHNFNISALQAGNRSDDVSGGIHPLISDIVASLPLYVHRLNDWNKSSPIGLPDPLLSTILPGIDSAWQQRVQASLDWHFGKVGNRFRAPIFKTGSIASSNVLLHDPYPLIQWLQGARSILAVEMESAGVYQAAQQLHKQYPVMAIRGIGDIIGTERYPQWAMYACETAASFAYDFVVAGIIDTDASMNMTNETQQGSVLMTPSYSDPTKLSVQTKETASEKSQSSRRAEDPIEVFISYSPRDERFLRELETHLVMLRREGIIRPWHSQYITAGREVVDEIDSHLLSAQLILLLVSSEFIASDYLYERELSRMLKREKEGKVHIVPIILRSCPWLETPIAKLLTLPRNNKPIASWSNRDEAWLEITQEIRFVCEAMLSQDTDQSLSITQSKQTDTTTALTHTQVSILSNRSSDPPSHLYRVGEVFVRKGPPDITFVESPDFKYLKEDLQPEGRSIVIEGPSGIGKTSAIKRAKTALGSSAPQPEYLSVRLEANRERLRTLASWHIGTLIIDDFHWLDTQQYLQIADYLKYLADSDSTDKKLIIIGIPHCGQALIDMAPDLATRVSVYKWQPANDEMILELIEKGEKALNISFASKAEIKQTASGSLFIAQSLCYNLCIEADTKETQHNTTTINYQIEAGIRRTLEDLENKFWLPALRFVALGGYKDTTCLDLLRELADTEQGVLSLSELCIKKAEMESGINRFISENWMEGLKKDYLQITNVLFYHSIGHVLVVEDPQLIFYLRLISLSKLAKAAGKIPQEAEQKPRLFICYSESEVSLLENLLLGLTPIQNQVTIDSWSDNDIPSGARDARDLEIAVKSSTFALILISQKFLITSGFITDYNLPMLLKGAKGITIIPVIATPCLFEDSGLDQFPAFNDPKRSLVEMTDIERDRVFVELASLIRKKLQSIYFPGRTI